MTRTVKAVFDSFYLAKQAVKELQNNGYPDDMIIVSEQSGYGSPAGPAHSKLRKKSKMKSEIICSDVGVGASIGAGIAGAFALTSTALITLGILHVPGLTAAANTTNAMWSLVTALIAGMAGGSLFGWLLGGSFGLGIPEEQAVLYARNAHQGGVVISVLSDWYTIDQAKEILNHHNPLDIREVSMAAIRVEHKDGSPSSQPPHRKSQEQD